MEKVDPGSLNRPGGRAAEHEPREGGGGGGPGGAVRGPPPASHGSRRYARDLTDSGPNDLTWKIPS